MLSQGSSRNHNGRRSTTENSPDNSKGNPHVNYVEANRINGLRPSHVIRVNKQEFQKKLMENQSYTKKLVEDRQKDKSKQQKFIRKLLVPEKQNLQIAYNRTQGSSSSQSSSSKETVGRHHLNCVAKNYGRNYHASKSPDSNPKLDYDEYMESTGTP